MFILSQDKTRIFNMQGHIEGIGYEEENFKKGKKEEIRHTIQVFELHCVFWLFAYVHISIPSSFYHSICNNLSHGFWCCCMIVSLSHFLPCILLSLSSSVSIILAYLFRFSFCVLYSAANL